MLRNEVSRPSVRSRRLPESFDLSFLLLFIVEGSRNSDIEASDKICATEKNVEGCAKREFDLREVRREVCEKLGETGIDRSA